MTEPAFLIKLGQPSFLAISELVFRYGSDQLRAKQPSKAISWLQQCHTMICDTTSDLFHEIRLKTCQNLCRAYLTRADESDLETVALLLEQATEEHTVAPWLYFLKIQYARNKYPTEAAPIVCILESMIRVVEITDSIFQTIIRNVHDLNKLDLTSACKVMDLLIFKVADRDETDLIERALVTRIWLSTQSSDTVHSEAVTALIPIFRSLNQKLLRPISPRATHASQIVSYPSLLAVMC